MEEMWCDEEGDVVEVETDCPFDEAGLLKQLRPAK